MAAALKNNRDMHLAQPTTSNGTPARGHPHLPEPAMRWAEGSEMGTGGLRGGIRPEPPPGRQDYGHHNEWGVVESSA